MSTDYDFPFYLEDNSKTTSGKNLVLTNIRGVPADFANDMGISVEELPTTSANIQFTSEDVEQVRVYEPGFLNELQDNAGFIKVHFDSAASVTLDIEGIEALGQKMPNGGQGLIIFADASSQTTDLKLVSDANTIWKKSKIDGSDFKFLAEQASRLGTGSQFDLYVASDILGNQYGVLLEQTSTITLTKDGITKPASPTIFDVVVTYMGMEGGAGDGGISGQLVFKAGDFGGQFTDANGDLEQQATTLAANDTDIDYPTGSDGPVPIIAFGGNLDDTIKGGVNGDTLMGGEGDDTLLGRGGADYLEGGLGDDIIDGGDNAPGGFGETVAGGKEEQLIAITDDNVASFNSIDLGGDTIDISGLATVAEVISAINLASVPYVASADVAGILLAWDQAGNQDLLPVKMVNAATVTPIDYSGGGKTTQVAQNFIIDFDTLLNSQNLTVSVSDGLTPQSIAVDAATASLISDAIVSAAKLASSAVVDVFVDPTGQGETRNVSVVYNVTELSQVPTLSISVVDRDNSSISQSATSVGAHVETILVMPSPLQSDISSSSTTVALNLETINGTTIVDTAGIDLATVTDIAGLAAALDTDLAGSGSHISSVLGISKTNDLLIVSFDPNHVNSINAADDIELSVTTPLNELPLTVAEENAGSADASVTTSSLPIWEIGDRASFANPISEYTITQNVDGSFTVSHATDGTDTLTNVEILEFSDQSLLIVPDQGGFKFYDAWLNQEVSEDWTQGTQFDDVINITLGGRSFIDAKAGDDVIIADPANSGGGDWITGGKGNDYIDGGARGTSPNPWDNANVIEINASSSRYTWEGSHETGVVSGIMKVKYSATTSYSTGTGKEILDAVLTANFTRTNAKFTLVDGEDYWVLTDSKGSEGFGTDILRNADRIMFDDKEVSLAVFSDPWSGRVEGTQFDDTILGTGRDDRIEAGAGDDVIKAGAGSDEIFLGRGNDYVDGGAEVRQSNEEFYAAQGVTGSEFLGNFLDDGGYDPRRDVVRYNGKAERYDVALFKGDSSRVVSHLYDLFYVGDSPASSVEDKVTFLGTVSATKELFTGVSPHISASSTKTIAIVTDTVTGARGEGIDVLVDVEKIWFDDGEFNLKVTSEKHHWGNDGQIFWQGTIGDDKINFATYASADRGTDQGGNPLSEPITQDEMFGEAGNDILIGGDGGDRLHGGEGNDILDGGANGTSGQDWRDADRAIYEADRSRFEISKTTFKGVNEVILAADGETKAFVIKVVTKGADKIGQVVKPGSDVVLYQLNEGDTFITVKDTLPDAYGGYGVDLLIDVERAEFVGKATAGNNVVDFQVRYDVSSQQVNANGTAFNDVIDLRAGKSMSDGSGFGGFDDFNDGKDIWDGSSFLEEAEAGFDIFNWQPRPEDQLDGTVSSINSFFAGQPDLIGNFDIYKVETGLDQSSQPIYEYIAYDPEFMTALDRVEKVSEGVYKQKLEGVSASDGPAEDVFSWRPAANDIPIGVDQIVSDQFYVGSLPSTFDIYDVTSTAVSLSSVNYLAYDKEADFVIEVQEVAPEANAAGANWAEKMFMATTVDASQAGIFDWQPAPGDAPIVDGATIYFNTSGGIPTSGADLSAGPVLQVYNTGANFVAYDGEFQTVFDAVELKTLTNPASAVAVQEFNLANVDFNADIVITTSGRTYTVAGATVSDGAGLAAELRGVSQDLETIEGLVTSFDADVLSFTWDVAGPKAQISISNGGSDVPLTSEVVGKPATLDYYVVKQAGAVDFGGQTVAFDPSTAISSRIHDSWIDGGDGDDVILAGQGRDDITGGAGDDFIDGGSASDFLADFVGVTPLASNVLMADPDTGKTSSYSVYNDGSNFWAWDGKTDDPSYFKVIQEGSDWVPENISADADFFSARWETYDQANYSGPKSRYEISEVYLKFDGARPVKTSDGSFIEQSNAWYASASTSEKAAYTKVVKIKDNLPDEAGGDGTDYLLNVEQVTFNKWQDFEQLEVDTFSWSNSNPVPYTDWDWRPDGFDPEDLNSVTPVANGNNVQVQDEFGSPRGPNDLKIIEYTGNLRPSYAAPGDTVYVAVEVFINSWDNQVNFFPYSFVTLEGGNWIEAGETAYESESRGTLKDDDINTSQRASTDRVMGKSGDDLIVTGSLTPGEKDAPDSVKGGAGNDIIWAGGNSEGKNWNFKGDLAFYSGSEARYTVLRDVYVHAPDGAGSRTLARDAEGNLKIFTEASQSIVARGVTEDSTVSSLSTSANYHKATIVIDSQSDAAGGEGIDVLIGIEGLVFGHTSDWLDLADQQGKVWNGEKQLSVVKFEPSYQADQFEGWSYDPLTDTSSVSTTQKVSYSGTKYDDVMTHDMQSTFTAWNGRFDLADVDEFVFVGDAGDDRIIGHDSEATTSVAAYAGRMSEYDISESAGVYTVTHKIPEKLGGTGVDTIENVDQIVFNYSEYGDRSSWETYTINHEYDLVTYRQGQPVSGSIEDQMGPVYADALQVAIDAETSSSERVFGLYIKGAEANDSIGPGVSRYQITDSGGTVTGNILDGNDFYHPSGGDNNVVDLGAGDFDMISFDGSSNRYDITYDTSTNIWTVADKLSDVLGGQGTTHIKNAEYFNFYESVYWLKLDVDSSGGSDSSVVEANEGVLQIAQPGTGNILTFATLSGFDANGVAQSTRSDSTVRNLFTISNDDSTHSSDIPFANLIGPVVDVDAADIVRFGTSANYTNENFPTVNVRNWADYRGFSLYGYGNDDVLYGTDRNDQFSGALGNEIYWGRGEYNGVDGQYVDSVTFSTAAGDYASYAEIAAALQTAVDAAGDLGFVNGSKVKVTATANALVVSADSPVSFGQLSADGHNEVVRLEYAGSENMQSKIDEKTFQNPFVTVEYDVASLDYSVDFSIAVDSTTVTISASEISNLGELSSKSFSSLENLARVQFDVNNGSLIIEALHTPTVTNGSALVPLDTQGSTGLASVELSGSLTNTSTTADDVFTLTLFGQPMGDDPGDVVYFGGVRDRYEGNGANGAFVYETDTNEDGDATTWDVTGIALTDLATAPEYLIVKDTVPYDAGGDGTDILVDIERIEFADKKVNLSINKKPWGEIQGTFFDDNFLSYTTSADDNRQDYRIVGSQGDDIIVGARYNNWADTLRYSGSQDNFKISSQIVKFSDFTDAALASDLQTRFGGSEISRVTVKDLRPSDIGGYGTDTLYSIEQIEFQDGTDFTWMETSVRTWGDGDFTGTQFGDVIVSNDNANHLEGRGGDDEIIAGGGRDWIRPGSGNDFVNGQENGTEAWDRDEVNFSVDYSRVEVQRVQTYVDADGFAYKNANDQWQIIGYTGTAALNNDKWVAISQLSADDVTNNGLTLKDAYLVTDTLPASESGSIGVNLLVDVEALGFSDEFMELSARSETWEWTDWQTGEVFTEGYVEGTPFGDNGANAIIGTNGRDTLRGRQGDDVLLGNAGGDNLQGSEGNDIIDGGANGTSGNEWQDLDVAEYGGNKSRFTLHKVSVDKSAANGYDGTTKVAVYGSADLVSALQGNSVFDAQLTSSDPGGTQTGYIIIDALGEDLGGTGVDLLIDIERIRYEDSEVDLGLRVRSDDWNGDGNYDFTFVEGTSEADEIVNWGTSTQENMANEINGYGGDDYIKSGEGADRISGGKGNDFLDGGDNTVADGWGYVGSDEAVFAGSYKNYSVTALASMTASEQAAVKAKFAHVPAAELESTNLIVVQHNLPAALGGTGTDLLKNIEYINFSDKFVAVSPNVSIETEFDDGGQEYAARARVDGTDGNDVLGAAPGSEQVTQGAYTYDYSGNDDFAGNDGNDIIYAGKGGDYIRPGSGDDIIFGGLNGVNPWDNQERGDTVWFSGDYSSYEITQIQYNSAPAIRVTDSDPSGDGDNILVGVENLEFRDMWINVGVTKFERYFYENIGGVETKVVSGTDFFGSIFGDTGSDGSGVRGTTKEDFFFGADGNDTFVGLDGPDRFEGGAGDDVFYGGENGVDMFGGPGQDTAVYMGSRSEYSWVFKDANGTQVSAGLPYAYIEIEHVNPSGIDEGTDTLFGVEALDFNDMRVGLMAATSDIDIDGDGIPDAKQVVGTEQADILVGSDLDDDISGGAGDDILLGGEGADVLKGGDGTDIIIGGADGLGSRGDVAVFDGNIADYTITTVYLAQSDSDTSAFEEGSGSAYKEYSSTSVTAGYQAKEFTKLVSGNGSTDYVDVEGIEFADSFGRLDIEIDVQDYNFDATPDFAYIGGGISSDNLAATNSNLSVPGWTTLADVFEVNNFIDGGAGDDTIDAGAGDDVIAPGPGGGTIAGGSGNDVVILEGLTTEWANSSGTWTRTVDGNQVQQLSIASDVEMVEFEDGFLSLLKSERNLDFDEDGIVDQRVVKLSDTDTAINKSTANSDGSLNDVISLGSSNTVVISGGGADTIINGSGADFVFGGSNVGFDESGAPARDVAVYDGTVTGDAADYSISEAGVVVCLSIDTATGVCTILDLETGAFRQVEDKDIAAATDVTIFKSYSVTYHASTTESDLDANTDGDQIATGKNTLDGDKTTSGGVILQFADLDNDDAPDEFTGYDDTDFNAETMDLVKVYKFLDASDSEHFVYADEIHGIERALTVTTGSTTDTLVGVEAIEFGDDFIEFETSERETVKLDFSNNQPVFESVKEINGSAYSDDIISTSADEIMTGGGGNDKFIFGSGGGADIIKDFDPDADKIIIQYQANGSSITSASATSSTFVKTGTDGDQKFFVSLDLSFGSTSQTITIFASNSELSSNFLTSDNLIVQDII